MFEDNTLEMAIINGTSFCIVRSETDILNIDSFARKKGPK